jgi:hypothetical protein
MVPEGMVDAPVCEAAELAARSFALPANRSASSALLSFALSTTKIASACF